MPWNNPQNADAWISFAAHELGHSFGVHHHASSYTCTDSSGQPVQVSSTWFPLYDRNPQRYVPNIFEATDADFRKATQRVYRSPQYPSRVELTVLSPLGAP